MNSTSIDETSSKTTNFAPSRERIITVRDEVDLSRLAEWKV